MSDTDNQQQYIRDLCWTSEGATYPSKYKGLWAQLFPIIAPQISLRLRIIDPNHQTSHGAFKIKTAKLKQELETT